MICGAVDIGSNTLRLIVAEVSKGKIKNIVYEQRYIIRLAEGIKQFGKISEAAEKRLTDALFHIKDSLNQFGDINVKFVGTSALREASNGEEIINNIYKNMGIKIEIITSEKEAELMFRGVSATLDLKDNKALLFDIGGGSTEYIAVDKGNIVDCKSFDMGVVKLADKYNFREVVSEGIFKQLFEEIETIISHVPDIEFEILVGTAGTATTLAAIDMKLANYDYRKVNGYKIQYKRVKEIFDNLCSMTIDERENVVGLEKGRGDLIIPGAAIVIKTMEHFKLNEIIISDFGLREGLVVSDCG
ncbi:MAG: Ppx/GppA phosphatase [Deferribacteraceae bacterium]|jgi:exopolyphosphatase/guanosine-5'-triphosphate,3'-diphosphate pyrophosphatase|nr:Ppx/GppA phosphatase [Deferribacteraceae bacterium]